MRLPRILLIVVDYYSAAQTRALIESALSAATGVELLIRVVDNAEEPTGSPSSFYSQVDRSDIQVLRPRCNLGYFGAARWVLEQEQDNMPPADWVIISNPDIRFLQVDFFASLASRHANTYPGCVAPRIRSMLNGHEENPFLLRRPSRLRMAVYRFLFATYPGLLLYQALVFPLRMVHGRKRPRLPASGAIYAAHGSCTILGRAYFEHSGDLRHHSFLYGEEIFLAESCRRLGLQVLFDPELELIHLGHATTGILKTPRLARWEGEAARRNFEAYFRVREHSE